MPLVKAACLLSWSRKVNPFSDGADIPQNSCEGIDPRIGTMPLRRSTKCCRSTCFCRGRAPSLLSRYAPCGVSAVSLSRRQDLPEACEGKSLRRSAERCRSSKVFSTVLLHIWRTRKKLQKVYLSCASEKEITLY